MSGSDVTKPEIMKSYIWLQTVDGSIEQMEKDVALDCPLIHRHMQTGLGSSETQPIILPETVNSNLLRVILDFCQFYHLPGRSDLERKLYNGKFFRMEMEELRELLMVAYSLEVKQLTHILYDACARLVEEKSYEEICEALEIPINVMEEKSQNPNEANSENLVDRLLCNLYARKRKELKEKQRHKQKQKNVVMIHEDKGPVNDDRPIDELLSFINGENQGPKEAKTSKNKKNRKGKNKPKKQSSVCTNLDSTGHLNNASKVPN